MLATYQRMSTEKNLKEVFKDSLSVHKFLGQHEQTGSGQHHGEAAVLKLLRLHGEEFFRVFRLQAKRVEAEVSRDVSVTENAPLGSWSFKVQMEEELSYLSTSRTSFMMRSLFGSKRRCFLRSAMIDLLMILKQTLLVDIHHSTVVFACWCFCTLQILVSLAQMKLHLFLDCEDDAIDLFEFVPD
jgi:hypothetical protein